MSWFGDLPIRRKLLVMTLASSAAALVLAASGFLAWDVSQYRSEVQQDVDAQATIISENSTAPLTFGDNRAAGETLAILRLRPRVVIACLYTAERRLFATYHRDASVSCLVEPPMIAGFDTAAYRVITDVTTGQKRIGTLYIQRDLNDLYARLRVGLATVAGLLLAAVLAAVLIAGRMQLSIASPLLLLANTARAISTDGDNSIRARATSNDEVGVVVRAFNDMLDRLAERTSALSRANSDLAREVDERRRAEIERTAALERERDANRLKDEFLATLSHELRTPLNAMLGWTRLLRTARVEQSIQERALESIERNAHAQTRLIEDLLEISRIVTGKLRIQMQETDLADVIDEALEVVRPAAIAKRIRLVSEVTVRPALTSGDPDRLQQVVWNVLSNAVKFTPEDGDVAIRLEQADGYRIVVRDSGIGVDPRFLPHLFEPFRQADGTMSRTHGGLGLGLAIARQLVELHGGTIHASSPGTNAGTTVEILLPSVVEVRPSSGLTAETAGLGARLNIDPGLLQDIEVLVVDDEDDARELLEVTLRRYGAHVQTAGSAGAALVAIGNRVPDVVLSDIGMPIEDGYSLIRRLRALPATHGGIVPAIAITAYATDKDRAEAIAAGYQAHIAKPFDAGQLASLIKQFGRPAHSQ